MVTKRTAMLTILAVVALAATGCDKQSTPDQPEAEAQETGETRARSESSGEQGAGGGEKSEAGRASETPKTLDDLPEGVNVLQNEMQHLNTAMRNILTLIANDSLEGIPAQIEKVHPARQLTMKAVKQGKYRPPVNGDKMETFKKLDDRFHKNLKGMLKAAKNDDLEKTTETYTDLIDGCTNCHTQFRFE